MAFTVRHLPNSPDTISAGAWAVHADRRLRPLRDAPHTGSLGRFARSGLLIIDDYRTSKIRDVLSVSSSEISTACHCCPTDERITNTGVRRDNGSARNAVAASANLDRPAGTRRGQALDSLCVKPQYRRDWGVLRWPACALLGLRPPKSEHTVAEGSLLQRYATRCKTIVELGVAEGCSAWEMRKVMATDGTMYLVDPYDRSGLGPLSPARLVAHRLVGSARRASVVWIEERSQDAAASWSTPIDFLFIDGDHGFEAVSADWAGWSPHVLPGRHVALHDARLAPWTDDQTGPVRLLERLRDLPEWDVVDGVDSLAILRRTA